MAVWVNGYMVSEYTDIRPRGKDARRNCRLEAGTISLQGHDPTTDLSFRNIHIAAYTKRKETNPGKESTVREVPESQRRGPPGGLFRPKKKDVYGEVYYYCVNCEKEFVDTSSRIPPIKCPLCAQVTAVYLRKCRCKECGYVFRAYLVKWDPEAKRAMEARKRGESVPYKEDLIELVREIDGKEWVQAHSPEGLSLLNIIACPKCEAWGTDVEPVFPKTEN